MFQTTVARPVSFTGVGLHSGRDVQIKFQPAPVDSGIVFFAHTPSGVRRIHPEPEAVTATALATTLSDGKASVSTVEHVLAALNGLRVDNVQVHVMGGEVPIMDGPAAQVVRMIRDAGVRAQHMERRVARIRRSLSVAGEGKAIHARPHHGFYVDYTIDFPHRSIGRQRLALEITPESFMRIADARTFGFLQEVEYLHSKGLALGGSLGNAVVLNLAATPDALAKRILDFSFGVASALDANVECVGNKVFALTRIDELTEAERSYLRTQGII